MSQYFTQKMMNFRAGSLKEYLSKWEKVTSDREILKTVVGLPVDIGVLPTIKPKYLSSRFSKQETVLIENEISSLLNKGVIQKSNHEIGEFISPIFLTPKSDGNFRLILNLKTLNLEIPYVHFKMDTLHTVLPLITLNCFMAEIDLKDAYYTVPIKQEHQKYLKFIFKGTLYKFVCPPNGLCSGPRKFTKLLKPVLNCICLY